MTLCRHELVLTGKVYDFFCTALSDYARNVEILLSLLSLPYTEVRYPLTLTLTLTLPLTLTPIPTPTQAQVSNPNPTPTPTPNPDPDTSPGPNSDHDPAIGILC
jgi:hypothetical protein